MSKWKIYAVFTIVFLIVAFSIASAADVIISNTIDVILTVDGQSTVFQLEGGNLNSFSVDQSSVAFSTPPGERIIFSGPINISFGAGTKCDLPGKSAIEIPGNTTMVVVPTRPLAVDPEYRNSCAGRQDTGGSTSGGGGVGQGGQSNQGSQSNQGDQSSNRPQGESPSKLKITDISGLASKTQERIFRVFQSMLANGTLLATDDSEYALKPKGGTKRLFALQVALGAIAGRNCGEALSFEHCKTAAFENNLIDVDRIPSFQISRAQFYEMLLRAANIPLKPESEIKQAYLCKDVRVRSPYARVIATAREYRITTLFSGGKCRPDDPFARSMALVYAARLLEALDKRAGR